MFLLYVLFLFLFCLFFFFFFFKQKTAYEMRISDWSSDVCSSDLTGDPCSARWTRRGPIPTCRPFAAPASLPARPIASRSRRLTATRSLSNFPPLQRLMNGCKIGRASCRERVCQYV